MKTATYARVLFAGPDLNHGSFAELARRQFTEQFGATVLSDLFDTGTGYDELWTQVRECLSADELPLLLVDLDPLGGSPQLDWLRGELQALAGERADRLFACAGDVDDLAALAELIQQPEKHLGCVEVPQLPESHAWSCIPPHRYRVLLCNGPRCTRRGALPLWKLLREELKAAGKLETADGVHITRTQCQFPCDQGPTLSVYPSGEWYRIRDAAEVKRLVRERFVEERAVPELIMRG
ncbi:(2Fe-2S) ferredoxin domain-containing protein [Pseudomonas alcaligenes]|jgi:(2Fe-2S) ferredoxin|uniref:(2Fe-2S) ferredoxin domain-containing protein n=1 Tax=Aquipseudomonas alcaligenes TaxID=43263 RepID=UPI002E7C0652|nr:(2Fe-2S) ferredoxin domain-containing protein [Pseudomonas alcaligenes]MEE1947447.1 (2Fe-2S) ferredoxin domain-containing protein [Pseudomonas alcaligenes]